MSREKIRMSQVRRDEIVPSLFLARFKIQFIRITTPKLSQEFIIFALAAKLHSCNKLTYLLITPLSHKQIFCPTGEGAVYETTDITFV